MSPESRTPTPPSTTAQSLELPQWHRPLLFLMLLLLAQLLVFFYALLQPEFSWSQIGLWSLRLYLHLSMALVLLSLVRVWLLALPLGRAYLCSWLLAILAAGLLEWLWQSWMVADWPSWFWQAPLASAILWLVILRMFYLQQLYRWQQHVQARMQLEIINARLQPHFLFNTLNSIAALIADQPAQAERGIEQLSSLLRASLKAELDLHSLAKELALVEDYLALEKLRLGARLAWHLDCPDSLHELRIPAMLLQPLVENAIKYGIASSAKGGKLLLLVEPSDGGYHLRLRNPKPEVQAQQGFGLALKLLQQRLDLHYQARSSMSWQEHADQIELCLWIPEGK